MVRKIKSTLPFSHIKIGYIKATIQAVEGRDAEKREIFGEFFSKQHEIDYDVSMVSSEQVSTLLHEVMHGIVHVFGIKFRDTESEEDVVNSLAGGMATVFKDNPDFLNWIQSSLTEDE